MPLDLDSPYFVDKIDNATEIAATKAQLDLALANNAWAIMYIHNPSNPLDDALTELINYAKGIGLTNVTMEEGLANTSYQ